MHTVWVPSFLPNPLVCVQVTLLSILNILWSLRHVCNRGKAIRPDQLNSWMLGFASPVWAKQEKSVSALFVVVVTTPLTELLYISLWFLRKRFFPFQGIWQLSGLYEVGRLYVSDCACVNCMCSFTCSGVLSLIKIDHVIFYISIFFSGWRVISEYQEVLASRNSIGLAYGSNKHTFQIIVWWLQ